MEQKNEPNSEREREEKLRNAGFAMRMTMAVLELEDDHPVFNRR